jgi:hypothetical protein
VIVGLYIRLKIHETPDFQKVLDKNERVKVPVLTVWREHRRVLVLGTLIALATFVLFYLMTVFALSWGTSALKFSRKDFLILQLFAVLFFALTIPSRPCGPTARAAAHPDLGLGRDCRVRPGDGAAVRLRRRHQVTIFLSLGLGLMG